jgi:hypothetical protein
MEIENERQKTYDCPCITTYEWMAQKQQICMVDVQKMVSKRVSRTMEKMERKEVLVVR